jgi:hypothetical protein
MKVIKTYTELPPAGTRRKEVNRLSNLEQRVAALEIKVAELEGRVPEQPKMKHLENKIANFQEIAEVISLNGLKPIPGTSKPNLIKPQNPA